MNKKVINKGVAMEFARHGDLLLKKVSAIPAGENKAEGNSHVLAEGEHTGHKHVITTEPGSLLKIVEVDGTMYIETAGSATVTHEEHKPITLEPGKWMVVHEVEYDPFAKQIRQVVD